MKNALLIIAGMAFMYVILKIISGSSPENNRSWETIKKLLATQQFNNVIKTNEFRELVKTSEFKNVISTLAEDKINTIAKTLVG